ncbi:MAG: hypothetical protein U1F00_10865 [Rhodoferax sp.]
MLGIALSCLTLDGLKPALPALNLSLFNIALVDPAHAFRYARGDAAGL